MLLIITLHLAIEIILFLNTQWLIVLRVFILCSGFPQLLKTDLLFPIFYQFLDNDLLVRSETPLIAFRSLSLGEVVGHSVDLAVLFLFLRLLNGLRRDELILK